MEERSYMERQRHVRCRWSLSPRGKLHVTILWFLIFEGSIPFHVQFLLYNKEAIVVHVIVALRQHPKGPVEKRRSHVIENWKWLLGVDQGWPKITWCPKWHAKCCSTLPRDMPASGVATGWWHDKYCNASMRHVSAPPPLSVGAIPGSDDNMQELPAVHY